MSVSFIVYVETHRINAKNSIKIDYPVLGP